MNIQELVKGRHTPPAINRSEILNIASGSELNDDLVDVNTLDMLFSLKLGYPEAKHEIDVVLNYRASYSEDLDAIDAIKQADFKVIGCHGDDFIEGTGQLDWLVLCNLHTQAAAKVSGLVPEWHYSQGQADFVGMDYFTFGDEISLAEFYTEMEQLLNADTELAKELDKALRADAIERLTVGRSMVF